MINFYNFWETLNAEEDKLPPLLDSGDDSKAMEVIRIGENVSKNFWDNFMRLCNNAEGFSELLGVRADQISQWPAKIKESLDKIQQSNKQKKNNMVSTGKESPPQMLDDTGNDGAGPVTFPDATKPTP